MHVTTIARQSLLGLGHETGRNAMSCTHTFDGIFEETCSVGHASNITKLEGRLEHAGTGLSMPSLNVAFELGARVENIVVEILVMHGSRQRITKHALCQRGKLVRGVVAEEGGGGSVVRIGVAEDVELVFG